MITEEIILDFMRETNYKPMTYQELEKHFGISDAHDFREFLKLLNELEQSGKILLTSNQRYGVPERLDFQRGRLQVHSKGFAFLIPDDREHPDVYVHANDLKSAMNGDIVLVRVNVKGPAGGKLEGEVMRIVTRAVTQVVGVFQNHEVYGFVLPDDKRINRDIFIPKHAMNGAVDGEKVVVKLVSYPEGQAAAEGEVVEILGHKDDPGVDILSIIRKHQLPEGFPEEVMAEADHAPDSITEEEIAQQGRRDLRGLNIVTIDGEDAKDLDDAVNVERLANGNYKLGVHIADVGYYVRESSALDIEAYNRGCSVYLVDRVIPMLPHRLSNGICSLNPQVDRLTLSCEMEFNEQMKVVKHDVFTSVIRTKERMTYNNVRKILIDEDPELIERYSDLVDDFRLMRELALKLRDRRMKRGAVDFDFVESKVIVDENGKAVDIVKRERSIAEQIIEEFMLAANETVAEHFHWLKVPFIYRIHEDPDQEKLQNFMAFAANFGHHVKGRGNSIHPRALQNLLEAIQGTKEQTVLSTMMLRSMKQAKYDAESTGHFGLAAEYYSHFTSPIRRYPDLVIHRVIREVVENGNMLSEKRQEYLAERMPDVAQQSSERERVAVDAERDTDALKKAEYMLDKVGEEFEGMISSITSFGMFIELENTVEGLIRLGGLTDDYYHFDDQHMVLIGERTSKVFRIGDEVKVRVANVNMAEYTIDFEMVDMKPRRAGGRGGQGRGFGGRDSGAPGGAKAGRGGKRGGEAPAAGGQSGGKGGKRGKRSGEAVAGGGESGGVYAGKRRKRGGEAIVVGGESGGRRGKRGVDATAAGSENGANANGGRRGKRREEAIATGSDSGGGGKRSGEAIAAGGNNGSSESGRRGKRSGDAEQAGGIGIRIGEASGATDEQQQSFGFGSGKGGYSSQGASSTGFDRNARGSYSGKGNNGSEGRRKKTSGSGIFIGEGPTPGSGVGGVRKRKSKGKGGDGTAAFVRKKKK